jgi:hypothetical protein
MKGAYPPRQSVNPSVPKLNLGARLPIPGGGPHSNAPVP